MVAVDAHAVRKIEPYTASDLHDINSTIYVEGGGYAYVSEYPNDVADAIDAIRCPEPIEAPEEDERSISE